jgi:hypothetical protein
MPEQTATLTPQPTATQPGASTQTQEVQQPTAEHPLDRDNLPPPPDWAKDWTDEDRRMWNAKGRLDPAGLWKSYVNADKLITSTQRVTLPREGDAEGEKAFRKAIGVPDTVDGYKVEVPEAYGDPELAKGFASAAHAAGLTPKQASALNAWWNEYTGKQFAVIQQQEEGFTKGVETSIAQLKTEWGAQYEQRFNAASRALMALGVTADQALAMEKILGTKEMVTKFYNLAEQMGGTGAIVQGTAQSPFRNEESARSFINDVRADTKRFNQLSADIRDPNAKSLDKSRWEEAHKIIAAEEERKLQEARGEGQWRR